jgi:alpha-beta hydrolase superfamily lysophospholipase
MTRMTPTPYTVEEYAAGDGYRLRYRRYPAGRERPRAHLVCIHGIQSHAGWYDHSCERLAAAGFAVSFLDRRGSGMNPDARGDAPGFRRLLDDLADFLAPLQAGRREVPVFLVAISWGGKLAAALQRRRPGLADGLALLCPGFRARVGPGFRQGLRIFLTRLVSPTRPFPIPLNEPELFTATPSWQQFLRDDPLRLHRATARLLIESVRLDAYLRAVPPHVTCPTLLLLAEHDRIIDNDRTRRFVARFAAADQEVIEYPGAHHTLEFEPDPDRHLADLQAWLDKHATAARARPEGPAAP